VPLTEVRHGMAASIAATATLVPAGTSMVTPFIFRTRRSDMDVHQLDPRWKIRSNGDLRFPTSQLIDKNSSRSK
jgi:hypothetical protein